MASFEPILSGFWLNFLFWLSAILSIIAVTWFILYYEAWFRPTQTGNVTLRDVFKSSSIGEFFGNLGRFIKKTIYVIIGMIVTSLIVGLFIQLFLFKYDFFI